jgi:putative tryptophan/tyrosine transport system substrate-binding protein
MNTRRKIILSLGSCALPFLLTARAQQGQRMRRVGVLLGLAENDPDTQARLVAFRQGLEKRGWVEGRNITLDIRYEATNGDRYPELAKELIALQPDMLLGHTSPVVAVLKRLAGPIPVVFNTVSDPVGGGLVNSLAHPGGNLTGLMMYEESIVGKWLAMLKDISPKLKRVTVVANPKTTPFYYFVRAAKVVAPALAIDVVSNPIESAGDIEKAIQLFSALPNGGLLFPPDSTVIFHRDLIVSLAARYRLPAVYAYHSHVAAGGLMSYGIDVVEMFRQTSTYVDLILRGTKPANLPVQAPTRFQTALNLKTAKALGLTVPPGLLVAADEVIE